jgi:hypothetical protein
MTGTFLTFFAPSIVLFIFHRQTGSLPSLPLHDARRGKFLFYFPSTIPLLRIMPFEQNLTAPTRQSHASSPTNPSELRDLPALPRFPLSMARADNWTLCLDF